MNEPIVTQPREDAALVFLVEQIAEWLWESDKLLAKATDERTLAELPGIHQARFRRAAARAIVGQLGWADATARSRTLRWVAEAHDLYSGDWTGETITLVTDCVREALTEYDRQLATVFREAVPDLGRTTACVRCARPVVGVAALCDTCTAAQAATPGRLAPTVRA